MDDKLRKLVGKHVDICDHHCHVAGILCEANSEDQPFGWYVRNNNSTATFYTFQVKEIGDGVIILV